MGSLTALSPLLRSSVPSRLIYKSYVKPMIAYSALVCALILKTNMQSLQAIQNQVSRLIGGYDWHLWFDKMHSDL